MRIRDEAQGRRRRIASPGAFLVGLLAVVAPLGAADGAPCASPGWLARERPAGRGTASPGSLAEALVVRFGPQCLQPFVVALELRLHFADRRAPVTVRSAPREFRPGERFLPGESYLVSRVFPESAVLLATLFEGGDCGATRVVGSLALAALDPEPDATAHRAACVLVVGAPDATVREGEPSAGARLAVFFAGDAA